MKKKKLLQRIEELEKRVFKLEQQPATWYYSYPIAPLPNTPWQPSWSPSWGRGTGDPMPDPTKIWCTSYESGSDE